MHGMRYFIAFHLKGAEGQAVDALREKIASRFDVHAAMKIPPHVTLFNPFDADPAVIEPLKNALRALAAEQPPMSVGITGFNSFDGAVWFLDVEQKPELLTLKEKIASAVRTAAGVEDRRAGRGTHFHLTLAYKDVTPEAFSAIGAFLRHETLPLTRMTVDAFTLFSYPESRWVSLAEFACGAP
jgi:2'-5' RNA ligase